MSKVSRDNKEKEAEQKPAVKTESSKQVCKYCKSYSRSTKKCLISDIFVARKSTCDAWTLGVKVSG